MIRPSITTFLLAVASFAQQEPGTGVIEGRVLHSITGAPVRRAFVRLFTAAPMAPLTAATDSEGKFDFIGLPPGSYRLRAERQGFEDRFLPFAIRLGKDEKLAGVEMRLRPMATIAGRVTDEDGEPVIRARVTIFKQTWRNGQRNWEQVNPVVATNEHGDYRAANIAPGRYLVQAFDTSPPLANRFGGAPSPDTMPTYHPNSISRAQATAVSLRAGTEASGIDIRAARVPGRSPARVQGRVTGAPPGSVISVGFHPTDGARGGGNTPAKPPDYTFDHTTPMGTYSIFANVYSGDTKAFGTLPITVTGDLSGVVVAVSRAPVVSGRVTAAEEGAKPDTSRMRITLERPDHPRWEARVDASGKFTMPDQIPQGRYSVDVGGVPAGFFVQSIRLGESEIPWDDFEMSTSAQLLVVLSRAGGTIDGAVTTRDGKPAPDVAVTLIPIEAGRRPEKSITDENGVFRFTGVRPGKYSLFALEKADDDLWRDPEFREPYRQKAAGVTVEAGASSTVALRLIELDE